MDKLLQTLMDALAVGSLYALIALGYTMVYGILKFINFAHSDVFVLGAWVSFQAALIAGFGPAGTDPASIAPWVWYAVGALTGIALALTLYERVLAKDHARTRASGTLLMVAAWAWALIALVLVARALKSQPGTAILAGGVILILAMGTCGLVGFSLERLAYKPLRKAPRLNVLITAIGVSLLLQNTGQLDWMFGKSPQRMPTLLEDRVLNRTVVTKGPVTIETGGRGIRLEQPLSLEAGRSYTVEITRADSGATRRLGVPTVREPTALAAGDTLKLASAYTEPVTGSESFALVQLPRVPIRLVDLIGGGTAIALMLLLDWLVFRTKLGRAMRAVSHNPQHAALMGIDVDKIISFTFVLGAMLAAAAGFLYSQKYPGLTQPAAAIWVLLGLKAFVAAVIGGIGNIRGAMLGGILIGLLEFFVAAYVPDGTQLRDIFVFGLLIVVLLVKPSGILGKSTIEKV